VSASWARRATRGRSPRRSCSGTRHSSWPTSRAVATPAGVSTRCIRVTASRSSSRSSTSTVTAPWTPRSSAIRTGRPPRSSRRCASGAPALFGAGIYGLPELQREAIAGADLVANPGCYPTATLLALAPLARAGLIADVVVDAKSGVSGAGRDPKENTQFVSATENVTPYGVGHHRHTPEIDQELAALGAALPVTFTPHLLPLDQGELVSCYVTAARPLEAGELARLYAEAYDAEPFVEVVDRPPGVREVRETNLARIHAVTDERTGKALVFAAIDNLWKGAASQAVQNLNLMYGRPETEGLET